jgi:phosphotransferase system HPr (HPr) family protein
MSKTPRNSGSRVEGEVVIGVTEGLSTKPVRAVHALTSRFEAQIEIETRAGAVAGARDVFNLLLLGAATGELVIVRCVGPDARAAFDAVVAILSGGEIAK